MNATTHKNTTDANPTGMTGISFVSFASPRPQEIKDILHGFGFTSTHENRALHCDYFVQNNIHCFVHNESRTDAKSKAPDHAIHFARDHGPCIPAMGWKFKNPTKAFEIAISRGAKAAQQSDFKGANGKPIHAIEGIGQSLIYFMEDRPLGEFVESMGFSRKDNPMRVPNLGFEEIDHLTNNVPKGTMHSWADFYKSVFGFTEVRYFDIRGAKTGLTSYALRSPCETFCIPINEGTEETSQINEYLRDYKGPGIQHLAFTTSNIISSIRQLKNNKVVTLDIDQEYYREVFNRVPNVTENQQDLRDLQILIDGDETGYLLQIFTKTIIGPIFIEIIQRKNHQSFGEGNFGALFRTMERDQEKRGVLR
jgi:4-hydroxyphenylpyruvate dioxygenase